MSETRTLTGYLEKWAALADLRATEHEDNYATDTRVTADGELYLAENARKYAKACRDIAAALTRAEQAREEAEQDAQAVYNDVHGVLDAAGIASAQGAVCNNTECQTKLGHRVRALVAERDTLRAALNRIP